ncbi:MAG TPA: hypothetical protein VMW19_04745 [Myxococcota bacterium]|nr:hypothetical protein [Myxococcota bacterium]
MNDVGARGRRREILAATALAATAVVFAVLVFGRLGHPLFWYDEAETAAYAQRVLHFGYPKIHDGKNTLYSLRPSFRRAGIGLDEATDAYTGSPWLQYYVGALGVAAGTGEGDLYARSAWVRLPFALAGCAGLVLLFAAVRPALGPGRARLFAFAALNALLLSGSVQLVLHLREARHYSLTVLGAAAFVFCFLHRHVLRSLTYCRYAFGLCGSLLWLFHAFYPAALAFGASSGLWLLGAALRRAGSLRVRAAWFAREAAPLLAAALLTAPLLGFFDFYAQTQNWVGPYLDASRWLGTVGFVSSILFRQEWLAPALALRVAVEWLARLPESLGDTAFARRLASARFLWLAILVYALEMTGIPLRFERYFIVLGPLLCAALLLDLASAWDLARAPAVSSRRTARAGIALAATAAAAVLALRAPEIAGRVAEIRTPYRGPLDYAIPYLMERYADPSALVIATNYEEPAFMFYLGSHVLVGFYAPDLAQDLEQIPDVIIARPWPDHMDALRELSTRAHYEPHALPVANLRWNNTPSLAPRAGFPVGHHFRDPVVGVDGPELVILERVPEPDAAPAAR